MITKIKMSEDYGPERHDRFSSEYIGEEELVTPRQIQKLTGLIYQNFQDEDDREKWLSQISEMSSEEAEEMILELSMSWCR